VMVPELSMVPVLRMPVPAVFDIVIMPVAELSMVPELLMVPALSRAPLLTKVPEEVMVMVPVALFVRV